MTSGPVRNRRAWFYLAATAFIWMAEAFLFSALLKYTWWQVTMMVVLYVGLFIAALVVLMRRIGFPQDAPASIERWRLAMYAPMTTVVAGSFLSLPLVVGVKVLGSLA